MCMYLCMPFPMEKASFGVATALAYMARVTNDMPDSQKPSVVLVGKIRVAIII